MSIENIEKTGYEFPKMETERGRWVYRPRTFELVWVGAWEYAIDLDDCTDAAQVLDWVIQLSHKAWMSDADLGKMIRAMDKVFKHGLQGAVCPWGENTAMDPRVEAGLKSLKE